MKALNPIHLMLAAACVLVGCQSPVTSTQPEAGQAGQVAPAGDRTIALRIQPPVERKALATVTRFRLENLSHYEMRLESWNGTAFAEVQGVPMKTAAAGSISTYTHLRPARYQVVVVGVGMDGNPITDEAKVEYDLSNVTGSLNETPAPKVAQMKIRNVVFAGKLVLPQVGVTWDAPHWARKFTVSVQRGTGTPVVMEYEASKAASLDNLEAFVAYTVTLSATNNNGLTTSDTRSFTIGADDRRYSVLRSQSIPDSLDDEVYEDFNLFPHATIDFEVENAVAGGAGELWGAGSDSLVRVKPDLSTTSIALPNHQSRLASDQAGGVWVPGNTDEAGNKLVMTHVSSTGVVNSYETPNWMQVEHVVPDTQGGAWFIGYSPNHGQHLAFVHVTKTGTVTVPRLFHTNLQGVRPDGQDGLVLAYEENGVQLARVSPQGTLTAAGSVGYLHYGASEWIAPGPDGGVYWCASGYRLTLVRPGHENVLVAEGVGSVTPDGTNGVWYGNSEGGKHRDAAGVITTYPGGTSARSVMLDPQGHPWVRFNDDLYRHYTKGVTTADRTVAVGDGTTAISGDHLWGYFGTTVNHVYLP